MQTTITSTITTTVDLDTFNADHAMSVDHEGILPSDAVMAAVEGALKTALASVVDRAER